MTMALSNDQELLLETKAEIETDGFKPAEWDGARSWRWSVQETSTVSFFAEAELNRIYYCLTIPMAGWTLLIYSGDALCKTFSSSEAFSTFEGFFEFSARPNERSVITLRATPAAGAAIHPSDPLLKFFVEHFSLVGVSSANIKSGDLAKARKGDLPDFFCSLPFSQLYLDGNQDIFPCEYSVHQLRAPLVEKNLEPMRFSGAAGMEAAWNSPILKYVRRKMLSGVKPSVCNFCIGLEKKGLESPRIKINRVLEVTARQAAPQCEADGNLPGFPANHKNFS